MMSPSSVCNVCDDSNDEEPLQTDSGRFENDVARIFWGSGEKFVNLNKVETQWKEGFFLPRLIA